MTIHQPTGQQPTDHPSTHQPQASHGAEAPDPARRALLKGAGLVAGGCVIAAGVTTALNPLTPISPQGFSPKDEGYQESAYVRHFYRTLRGTE
ncbi:MAG: hypothetical protein ACRCYV_01220 [Aeromonas sp.]